MDRLENYLISMLECSIGYKFKDVGILYDALSHSSFVNENCCLFNDNERLEFLGDSILNFIISNMLVKSYPDFCEGFLSKMRASLINDFQLAFVARSLKLGNYLSLGKGELKTCGKEKDSILSGALEAIIAAIYLDGGFHSSFIFVKNLFNIFINIVEKSSIFEDYKTNLQEKAQELFSINPKYIIVDEYGPEHNKFFVVKMVVVNIESYGKGKNIRSAEQAAAKIGLKFLLDK